MTIDATRFKTLQTNSTPKINPDLRRTGVVEDTVETSTVYAPKPGAAERRTPPAAEQVEVPGLPKRYQARSLSPDAKAVLSVIREMNQGPQLYSFDVENRDPNAPVTANGALAEALKGKTLSKEDLNTLTEEVVHLYPAGVYPRAFLLNQVTADFDAALTALQNAGADINASSIYYRAMDDDDTKTPLNYFVWENGAAIDQDRLSISRSLRDPDGLAYNSNKSFLNGLLVLLDHGADPKTLTRGTIESALFGPGIDISAQIPELAKRGTINLKAAEQELTKLIEQRDERTNAALQEAGLAFLKSAVSEYPDNKANLKAVRDLLAAQ